MISMLNENNYYDGGLLGPINATDFSSVSLTEASYIAMQNIDEMMNDLKFSVLMNEYTYLLNTGREIVYEAEGAEDADNAEDDTDTKKSGKFKSIIQKIGVALRKFVANILGLINKAMDKIKTSVSTSVAKIGISKKSLSALSDSEFDTYFNESVDKAKLIGFSKYAPTEIASNLDGEVLVPFYYNKGLKRTEKDMYTVDRTVKEFTRAYTDGDKKYYSKSAIADVLFGDARKIGSQIMKVRKTVEKNANVAYADAKKANPEDLGEIFEQYQFTMKRNTAIVSGLLKIFVNYVQCCAIVARGVLGGNRGNVNKNLNRTSIYGDKATDKAKKAVDKEKDKASKSKKFDEKKATILNKFKKKED